VKKIKSFLKRAHTKIVSNRRLYTIVILIIGLIIGFGVGALVFRHPNKKSKSTVIDMYSSKTVQSRSDRLKKTYQRCKSIIASDLKTKKITDKQAQAITKKLDEVYAYKKSVLSNEDASDELRVKRDDLRKWADENKVSKKYFLGIL
jgi:uncharacterized membrane-anchored protein YhcB (DUF1043 family)